MLWESVIEPRRIWCSDRTTQRRGLIRVSNNMKGQNVDQRQDGSDRFQRGSRQTGHPGSKTRHMGPVEMWVPYTEERFGVLGLRGEEWSGQTAKVQRHRPDSEVGEKELHLQVERWVAGTKTNMPKFCPEYWLVQENLSVDLHRVGLMYLGPLSFHCSLGS